MATNVSPKTALRSVLSDVQRHRFTTRRQVNPTSILYQTIQRAVKEALLADAIVDLNPQHQLATFDLTHASLTPAGKARLRLLTTPEGGTQ